MAANKPPDDESGQPKSYDVGLLTPAMRDRLLDAIRRHPTVDRYKKELVDLLETAQPTDWDAGQLRWSELERELERLNSQGDFWGWGDVFERMGRKR